MIHPSHQLKFINPSVGLGVFATEFMPKGTIVYVKDKFELVLSQDEIDIQEGELKAQLLKYSYRNEKGEYIISWDNAKFVNHCCQANTLSTGYGFEIAIRDIYPGEQITDDYGMFNLDEEMAIQCPLKSCRKAVTPSDPDTLFITWDHKVKEALAVLNMVPQPLIDFIEPQTRKELEEYFLNPENYRSVITLKMPEIIKSNGFSSHE